VTVAARRLEEKAEPIFHKGSYGYRPGRSALDAVAACRKRCWEYDWVVDLDIQKFFGSVPWDLMVKAVEARASEPWVVLYVRRWLAAPLKAAPCWQQEHLHLCADGRVVEYQQSPDRIGGECPCTDTTGSRVSSRPLASRACSSWPGNPLTPV
jgi:hypothetical protein